MSCDYYTARALHVRTSDSPDPILGAVQREAVGDDPGLRYARVQTIRDIFAPEARAWSLGATMFSAFGLLAPAFSGFDFYAWLGKSFAVGFWRSLVFAFGVAWLVGGLKRAGVRLKL